jgi:hypothetical protein
VKWPTGYRFCKYAGSRSYWVSERRREQCAARRHQIPVTAGTIFHKTRAALRPWFRALVEFVGPNPGCSARHRSRVLGLHYETAWTWLQQIRGVFTQPGRTQLEGTVEAGGSHAGAPETGSPGRSLAKKKLLIADAGEVTRRGCSCARLVPIASARAERKRPTNCSCWV